MDIKLGEKTYFVSYNWEAVEGVQADLEATSLSELQQTVAKVIKQAEDITNKEMANVMKVAKVIVYHGIRGYCFENDLTMEFKTPSHVGARMKSFKDAGKHIGLFFSAMNKLFTQDDEAPDTGEAKGEATPL